MSRPSRLGRHSARLIGMRGSSPRMTAGVSLRLSPIQLSNSQVFSEHASSSSLGAGPARASDFLFDMRSRKSAERVFAPNEGAVLVAPSKRGAERRKAHPGCLPFAKDRRRSCETGSPYGAPPRRLKSLGPRFPLAPISQAFAWSGGCKDRALGVYLAPGGRVQGLPGLWLRTTGAGAAPPSRSVAPRERPHAKGDGSDI